MLYNRIKKLLTALTTQGAITKLTDNSGGTASNTIAVISDTATKNAIASLTAKVNAMIDAGALADA